MEVPPPSAITPANIAQFLAAVAKQQQLQQRPNQKVVRSLERYDIRGEVPEETMSTLALMAQHLTDGQRDELIKAHTQQMPKQWELAEKSLHAHAADRKDIRKHKTVTYLSGLAARLLVGALGVGAIIFLIDLLLRHGQSAYVPMVIAAGVSLLGGGGAGYALGYRKALKEMKKAAKEDEDDDGDDDE